MPVVFETPLFDAQFVRALDKAPYGGADFFDCWNTARRITDGDFQSWYQEWLGAARTLEERAQDSLHEGHTVSARESFLMASNYYRTAMFGHFRAPVSEAMKKAFRAQRDCFQKATTLMPWMVEEISVPLEDTHIPGYLFLAAPEPRPVMIATGGYDSTLEELYFFNAEAALRRGYHCLVYDGPGQGSLLIEEERFFRHDWESVVSPLVDFLLARDDVDTHRIVLSGLSWGGYLAPRAASKEHRLAALICDPGQADALASVRHNFPLSPEAKARLPEMTEEDCGHIDALMEKSLPLDWSLRRCFWVHGVESIEQLVSLYRDYHTDVEAIRCPTLVTQAESDPIAALSKDFFNRLTGPRIFLSFTDDEGAGWHCQTGARTLFHQRTFDWLDRTLEFI
jgi:dienelactone hydrolase